ncbi:MAG: hypothetical protein MZV63_07535 [Marinilabiliales bacterium]|nr:hypothetical protein [Marinilabiliales bacterium]
MQNLEEDLSQDVFRGNLAGYETQVIYCLASRQWQSAPWGCRHGSRQGRCCSDWTETFFSAS